MLSKFCDRCHKRLNIGEQCKCTLSKYQKDTEDFYRTSSWLKVRDHCIELCCGLDLYSLFVYKTIEYGRTVHHIVPLKKDESLALEQSNLIYLQIPIMLLYIPCINQVNISRLSNFYAE